MLDLRMYSCDPHWHRTRVCVGEPHLAAPCRRREPQRVGTRLFPEAIRCEVEPSWPPLSSSPPGLSLVAALLSLHRHCGMPPQSRCRHGHAAAVPAQRRGLDAGMRKLRPCLVQPRTHVPVPSRAAMRALAWRGQGQTFGSLSRQTLSALRPATGHGFAANGDPSSSGVRAPARSRSCTLAQAHERANPVVTFPTSSETKASRSRPPRLSTSLPRTPFRPPGRTSVRPSQCMCSSTRPHAGEHPGVPPWSSPFCSQTSCELKPSPSTFPSSPGKPRS
jgi:hypothetical protein